MTLFMLWLYWDNLWPKALAWWEERRLHQTREALKHDLSARVDLRYVHMMTVLDRAERERKARFRQRWRSRFRSWWRVMTLPWVMADRELKALDKWLRERLSFHHVEEDTKKDQSLPTKTCPLCGKKGGVWETSLHPGPELASLL